MGNVNVTGAPLEFAAGIDMKAFEQATASMNKTLEELARQQEARDRAALKAQQDYAQTIISTGRAFSALDGNVQNQIRSLAALQTELQQVKQAQATLSENKQLGDVGTQEAAASMAALIARERELSASIQKVSQDMQTSDAIMRAASGSIMQKTLQLENLKKEYLSLSEVDRNSAAIGGGLLSKIQALDTEVRAVSTSFQAVQANAVGSINAKVDALAKVKAEYSALADIDRSSDLGRTMLTNIHTLDAEVRELNNSFQAVQQNAVGSLNDKVATLNKLRAEYAALAESDRNSRAGKTLRDNIAGLDKEVQKINGAFTETESLAKKAALALGAYATLTTATNFVQDVVRVRGEFQQLEVAFNTMLGSKEKADKLMMEVTQFAATTPFELKDVASAAKQLLAFGIDADKVKDTLRSLGDVSAGIGAPLGDIAYLYGTIKTAGVANNEDIKQFAQRGIPIYEELAKVLGTNVESVKDLVTAGKVGFPQIEKAFQSMTAEGSKFGGLMEAQSHTLTGQLSNLSDAWNNMLNDIGKSGEGVFSSSISAVTSLIQNYEKVVDVLKVVALTYGTYKAATLAAAAAQAIQTSMTEGYTLAEALRYRAMLISEGAMKLLNRTMLSNPYVAVATALVAVVSALAIFSKTASEAKSAAELLEEAQSGVGDKMAEQEAKIRPYVDALKGANVSEQERVNIYNQLKAVDPKIVEGLDAKTISYDKLRVKVDEYLGALRRQFQLEASEEAIQASVKQENKIRDRITALNKKIVEANKAAREAQDRHDTEGSGIAQFSAQEARTDALALNDSLKEQIAITEELGKVRVKTAGSGGDAAKRTLKMVEDDIKAAKDAQQQATNNTEFLKYGKAISVLEEEKKRIVGATKKELKDEENQQTKINAELEKTKNLLERINGFRADARQSGLIKEASEIDRINEKYDKFFQDVVERNKKIDELNKKNGTKLPHVPQTEVNEANRLRGIELKNYNLKADADKFKTHLEGLKKIFADYEAAKAQIGEEAAKNLYGEQLEGFNSYADALKQEFAKVAPKIVLGVANVGDQLKFQQTVKQKKDLDEQQAAQQIANAQRVFLATLTIKDRELQVNGQFEADLAALRVKFAGNPEELAAHTRLLAQKRDASLAALKEQAISESALMQQIGQSTLAMTKAQIRERLTLLKKSLKDGVMQDADGNTIKIPPEVLAKLKEYIGQMGEAVAKNEELVGESQKFATIASGLNELAGAIGQINGGLGEAVGLLGQMGNSVATVSKSLNDFNVAKASGDVAGQIGALANVATVIVTAMATTAKLAKEVQQSLNDAREAIRNFRDGQIKGESELNELYRQRARDAVALTQLTYDRIRAEKALLDQQKQQAAAEYNRVLAQLQNENAVTEVRKKVGYNMFGLPKFETVKEYTSLVGKSFEELEVLFTKGQLTDNAKALFEQLQKLKQEGVDIDAMLAENKRKAQEIFTGTTAESITDTIIQGFANGLNSAADFAGSFEDLMKQAMLNSLKFKYLEGPLKDFFNAFADASESDGQLTQLEVSQLQGTYDAIINNAQQQFQQLQTIAGINFNAAGATGPSSSLTGAIKGMTEQQAELLAAQFGGLRMTALDQLTAARSGLLFLQNIETNTALSAQRLGALVDKFSQYETGAKSILTRL